jgi:hypothetical protein
MRPGMKCLLQLLRGQSGERVCDEAELRAMLTLAEEEHLLPYAAGRLRALRSSLTPAISGQLDRIEREAAISSFYWCAELKSVLRAFRQQEIRVVSLKGPVLAERLYGNAALRGCRDLDLLVGRADLTRAEDRLRAIGFVPGTGDDYHRLWSRATTTVELHHDVENPLAFNFEVAGAIERARPVEFQGEGCWQLAPEDELLFLCLHGVRHRFEQLSLILDLELAFQRLAGPEWHPRPEVAGLDCLITLGRAMAGHLRSETAAGLPLAGSARQRRHLEKLADRLWSRLLNQVSEPLDWRALHAFYLEIELAGWPRMSRRIRHLRILAGRTIGPDFEFAARLRLHRDWQVRLLRPLRLLSNLKRPKA